MFDFIFQNKELIKPFYSLLIAVICLFIVAKSHKFFKLSLHQGIRYFRNAYLFYAIAVILRFLIWPAIGDNFFSIKSETVWFLFEFFLIMGGFFLLYSLIWKKLETRKEPFYSSLFNFNISIFYLMAIVLAFLDFLWGSFYLLFSSQIFLFFIMSLISIRNCCKKNKRFQKLYLIAMLSGLIAWIINGITSFFFLWNVPILILIYFLNIILFLLFLYGVLKVIRG